MYVGVADTLNPDIPSLTIFIFLNLTDFLHLILVLTPAGTLIFILDSSHIDIKKKKKRKK